MGFTLYLIDISGVVLLAGSCRDDPESNLASLIALDLPGVSVDSSPAIVNISLSNPNLFTQVSFLYGLKLDIWNKKVASP